MMQLRIARKLMGLALCAVLLITLVACGQVSGSEMDAAASSTEPTNYSQVSASTAEPVELIVFAAASLTETMMEIAKMAETDMPGMKITLNLDSSGTLKTQIQEGAACDVFISAAQKQMNQLDASLDATINPDGLDFVVPGSRADLLENKVALVVPDGNPKGVTSFSDMAEKLPVGELLLAMGNSDVPVGQYTQKILTYFDLDEQAIAAAGSITYGSNVKEVTTQVREGSVDCGVVYSTDATSAGLEIIDVATADMCGQVIYPAAVIKASQNMEAAQAFLDYLKTDACQAVFEKVGFAAVS